MKIPTEQKIRIRRHPAVPGAYGLFKDGKYIIASISLGLQSAIDLAVYFYKCPEGMIPDRRTQS